MSIGFQCNLIDFFILYQVVFLDGPKIYKHNILKKPFKTKQINTKYNFDAAASNLEFFVTIVIC